jgi:hypothetical protein
MVPEPGGSKGDEHIAFRRRDPKMPQKRRE